MNTEQTYEARIVCNNCQREKVVFLPKGESVDKYLSHAVVVCQNCGCKEFSRHIFQP